MGKPLEFKGNPLEFKRNSLENVNQETPKASASETISSSDSSKNNEKVNVTCTDDNL